MNKENSKVDAYLMEGCGRCPLGGTPDCKVHDWQEELIELRRIVNDCGLKEELKRIRNPFPMSYEKNQIEIRNLKKPSKR